MLTAQSDTSEFPKVVQAHASGEVGILGTALLRIYSGTTCAIFIEIGLYLTDRERKISWHSFFWDTVYMTVAVVLVYLYLFLHNCFQKPRKAVQDER